MPIPGSRPIPGRQFLYVEAASEAEFQTAFHAIGAFIEEEPLPFPEGGMISENTKLILRDGPTFFGLSFKGDVVRWEAGIRGFCKARQRRVGGVIDQRFVLDDGQSMPLESCTVEQY